MKQQIPGILNYLNWDILHDHILPYLDLGTLHQLSATCHTFYELVDSHLAYATHITITEKIRKSLKERHLLMLAPKTGNLRNLDLSNMSNAVSNKVLKSFLNSNCELKILNISKCSNIGPDGFNIDHGTPSENENSYPLAKLEVLVANWCRNIKPQCFVSLAHAPLRAISLAGTWYTNDEAVTDCATFFKDNLECLNIDKCYKVTDESLNLLVHCSKLRILKVTSCWRVNDGSVRRIVESCKELQQVAMDDCRSITKSCLFDLSEKGILLLEARGERASEKWDRSDNYLRRMFRF